MEDDSEGTVVNLSNDILETAIRAFRKVTVRSRNKQIKLLTNTIAYIRRINAETAINGELMHTALECSDKLAEVFLCIFAGIHPLKDLNSELDCICRLASSFEKVLCDFIRNLDIWCRNENQESFYFHLTSTILNDFLNFVVQKEDFWFFSIVINAPVAITLWSWAENEFFADDRREWSKDICRTMFSLAKIVIKGGDITAQYGLTILIQQWLRWVDSPIATNFLNTSFSIVDPSIRRWLLDEDCYDFDYCARVFLNALNCCPRSPKLVTSIKCEFVFIGEDEIKAPEHNYMKDFWVDFCSASRRIHMLCTIGDNGWVEVNIRVDQIDSVCISCLRKGNSKSQISTQRSDTQMSSLTYDSIAIMHIFLKDDFTKISNDLETNLTKRSRSLFVVFHDTSDIERVVDRMRLPVHTCGEKSCKRPKSLFYRIKDRSNTSVNNNITLGFGAVTIKNEPQDEALNVSDDTGEVEQFIHVQEDDLERIASEKNSNNRHPHDGSRAWGRIFFTPRKRHNENSNKDEISEEFKSEPLENSSDEEDRLTMPMPNDSVKSFETLHTDTIEASRLMLVENSNPNHQITPNRNINNFEQFLSTPTDDNDARNENWIATPGWPGRLNSQNSNPTSSDDDENDDAFLNDKNHNQSGVLQNLPDVGNRGSHRKMNVPETPGGFYPIHSSSSTEEEEIESDQSSWGGDRCPSEMNFSTVTADSIMENPIPRSCRSKVTKEIPRTPFRNQNVKEAKAPNTPYRKPVSRLQPLDISPIGVGGCHYNEQISDEELLIEASSGKKRTKFYSSTSTPKQIRKCVAPADSQFETGFSEKVVPDPKNIFLMSRIFEETVNPPKQIETMSSKQRVAVLENSRFYTEHSDDEIDVLPIKEATSKRQQYETRFAEKVIPDPKNVSLMSDINENEKATPLKQIEIMSSEQRAAVFENSQLCIYSDDEHDAFPTKTISKKKQCETGFDEKVIPDPNNISLMSENNQEETPSKQVETMSSEPRAAVLENSQLCIYSDSDDEIDFLPIKKVTSEQKQCETGFVEKVIPDPINTSLMSDINKEESSSEQIETMSSAARAAVLENSQLCIYSDDEIDILPIKEAIPKLKQRETGFFEKWIPDPISISLMSDINEEGTSSKQIETMSSVLRAAVLENSQLCKYLDDEIDVLPIPIEEISPKQKQRGTGLAEKVVPASENVFLRSHINEKATPSKESKTISSEPHATVMVESSNCMYSDSDDEIDVLPIKKNSTNRTKCDIGFNEKVVPHPKTVSSMSHINEKTVTLTKQDETMSSEPHATVIVKNSQICIYSDDELDVLPRNEITPKRKNIKGFIGGRPKKSGRIKNILNIPSRNVPKALQNTIQNILAVKAINPVEKVRGRTPCYLKARDDMQEQSDKEAFMNTSLFEDPYDFDRTYNFITDGNKTKMKTYTRKRKRPSKQRGMVQMRRNKGESGQESDDSIDIILEKLPSKKPRKATKARPVVNKKKRGDLNGNSTVRSVKKLTNRNQQKDDSLEVIVEPRPLKKRGRKPKNMRPSPDKVIPRPPKLTLQGNPDTLAERPRRNLRKTIKMSKLTDQPEDISSDIKFRNAEQGQITDPFVKLTPPIEIHHDHKSHDDTNLDVDSDVWCFSPSPLQPSHSKSSGLKNKIISGEYLEYAKVKSTTPANLDLSYENSDDWCSGPNPLLCDEGSPNLSIKKKSDHQPINGDIECISKMLESDNESLSPNEDSVMENIGQESPSGYSGCAKSLRFSPISIASCFSFAEDLKASGSLSTPDSETKCRRILTKNNTQSNSKVKLDKLRIVVEDSDSNQINRNGKKVKRNSETKSASTGTGVNYFPNPDDDRRCSSSSPSKEPVDIAINLNLDDTFDWDNLDI